MCKTTRLPIMAFIVLTLLIFAACATPVPETANRPTSAPPASPAPGASNENVSPAAPPAGSEMTNTGSIKVQSTPAGAEVLLITEAIGGASPPEPRGTTPTTITDLAPGTYTVHLEKPGYKFFQKSVQIKPGETATVTATMKR
jgi:hypothetical protein